MAQILRVSILGSMPSGEVWSVNPCWEIDGSTGQPVSPAQALTIATAINAAAVPSTILQIMAPDTRLIGVRVEARTLAGVLEAQAEQLRASSLNGTGTSTHPYQTSIVVSLRTPGVGPSARGRLYWPATGVPLGAADYRISTANTATFIAAFKTLLSGYETAIKTVLPNANLTVWSRKTLNFHDVNSLQMGNVVDTQRRRRDALIENVSSVVYP